MVGNESLDDYIQLMTFKNGDNYATQFKNEMDGVIADFIDEYNDTNCTPILTVSDKPEISMLISIENISRNGNTITANYIFTNKESGNVLVVIQMTAKDGRCGSFTNLMGDAFEEAGRKLGKYIKKNLKQKKTKN